MKAIDGQSDADKVKESELRSSGKVAQDDPQANYFSPDQGPFKCSHCEYFIVGGACEKVEGQIDPDGCCNLFEKAELDDDDS